MSVSVVVPAYNAAAMLPRCLRAVRASGGDDIELLVVDDGSTDDTAAAAASLGATVVSLASGGGPAAARNRGAQAATSDVVLFVDAEDLTNVGVVQRCRRLGLSDQTGFDVLLSQRVTGEEFQGDSASQVKVLGLVHLAHRTGAQLLEDSVVRDRLADHDAQIVLLGEGDEATGADSE